LKEGVDVKDKTGGEKAVRLVWMVSREYDQLAGAGGVKDVCRQLAETLAAHGDCSVRVVLPRYGFMDAGRLGFSLVHAGQRSGRIGGQYYDSVFEVDMHYTAQERREPVAIWQAVVNRVSVFLVEADRFATKRSVYTYTEEDEQEAAWQRKGSGHYDYFAMNILLQKAALDLMILLDERPDVVHCHDGHAATLPAMMHENSGYRHYFRHTGAVVTIHNAGQGYHQEVGDLAFARAVTGLPMRVIMKGRLGGSFDPFIAASAYAVLNTVSEQYGQELQATPDDARTGWLGHALLERGVTLTGITNGVDPASFDPSSPGNLGLAAGYSVALGELEGKKQCKRSLLTTIEAHGRLGAGQAVWRLGRLAGYAAVHLYRSLDRAKRGGYPDSCPSTNCCRRSRLFSSSFLAPERLHLRNNSNNWQCRTWAGGGFVFSKGTTHYLPTKSMRPAIFL
jgi:starch synthase